MDKGYGMKSTGYPMAECYVILSKFYIIHISLSNWKPQRQSAQLFQAVISIRKKNSIFLTIIERCY